MERISTEKRRPIFSRPGQKGKFRSRRLQETSIYVHGNFTIDFTSSRLFFPRFPPRCHGHTVIVAGARRSHCRLEENVLPYHSAIRPFSLTHSLILFYFSLVLDPLMKISPLRSLPLLAVAPLPSFTWHSAHEVRKRRCNWDRPRDRPPRPASPNNARAGAGAGGSFG